MRFRRTLISATLVWAACSGPPFVAEITIDNPSDYTAGVSVRGGPSDGWLLLTTVSAGGELTIEQVIDQGGHWIFRFDYLGHVEEVEVSRDDLESSGWRIVVPASFESGLRARGVPPPP